jgi:hypothetical protein
MIKFMKKNFTFLILLSASTMVLADSRTPLPDIANAFKDGKLIEKVELNLSSSLTYEYDANFDFTAYKTKLIKFLGQEWNEKEITPQRKEAVKKSFKRLGIDHVDHANFSNLASPDKEIGLSVRIEKIADRHIYIVTIASIDWNAEQGSTGQPATRPESKPDGGDKPQPEAEGRSR